MAVLAGGGKDQDLKDTMKNVVWERWKEYYSKKMESDNAVKKEQKVALLLINPKCLMIH